MRCDEVMAECEQMERYECLSFRLALHLLYCKKCRKNVHNMVLATHFYHSKIRSSVEKNNALYIQTMNKILKTQDAKKMNISIRKNIFSICIFVLWCIIGMFSLFAYIFLPSTKMGLPFISAFGPYFKLQFFIILSLFFTTYTIFFIARNIELLAKAFRLSKNYQN